MSHKRRENGHHAATDFMHFPVRTGASSSARKYERDKSFQKLIGSRNVTELSHPPGKPSDVYLGAIIPNCYVFTFITTLLMRNPYDLKHDHIDLTSNKNWS